ncbi:hypothetical protein [uncultured Meiothermus sp.]|jgi:hypothetical protein|uniref:hypothetical protein n=1 Tax=uncultured Meiothermus sp. TaxID=157471 RepID=UPI00261039C4|nr:hypothetical protein [uncultured Meiothermus sp.]
MAYYLVSARAKKSKLEELKTRLLSGEIRAMRPFGTALDSSLRGARVREDGLLLWEEQDYCVPPLAMERTAVLDDYFHEIAVEPVQKGQGWKRIAKLPHLWPLS